MKLMLNLDELAVESFLTDPVPPPGPPVPPEPSSQTNSFATLNNCHCCLYAEP